MTVYAESSAVLAWLFDEASGPVVARTLATADSIATSEITIVECDRAILRRLALGQVDGNADRVLRTRLADASAMWSLEAVTSGILARARASFPDDTLRTLDAIHLATAVVLLRAGAGIEMLSLDERIRSNARRLGLRVLPD